MALGEGVLKKRFILLLAALLSGTWLGAVTVQYGPANFGTGVTQYLTLTGGSNNLMLGTGSWISPLHAQAWKRRANTVTLAGPIA